MPRYRKTIAAAALTALAAAFALATVLAPSASAAAASKCPSGGTPPPGSTIKGGLEVDGQCFLTGVTVDGGITIDASAKYFGLVLNSSTVTGGIVSNGGELDAGIDFSTGEFTQNTIAGGVRLNDPADLDIVDATIRGGFRVNRGFPTCPFGQPCIALTTFCGNVVYGDTTISDLYQGTIHLGDPEPDEACGALGIPGNVFYGSLSLINSNYIVGPPFIPPDAPVESNEIEGNTVTGSVHITASTAEVYGNTIGGSLLCSSDTVLLRPLGLDPTGNAVNGQDICT